MKKPTRMLFALVPMVALTMACSSAAPAAPPPPTAKPAAPAAAAPTTAPTAVPAVAAQASPAAAPSASVNPAAAPVVALPKNAAGSYSPTNTLMVYGDMVLFGATSDNPEACNLKNRFKAGEAVGFRATAIDPATGSYDATAQLTVKLATGETLPMMYRDSGTNPRPGFWTAKWVVPDSAPKGVLHYTVQATDSQGHTAVWAPFNIDASLLTIVQ